ncbi:MAG: hypothetical protein K0R57_5154 [Paenibacillaceae bacterium]|jgi:hypothetical protein|nr:hypothetical protein [Paenibacillaceae bacterium]
MGKRLKRVSATLLVSLLISVFVSVPVFAEGDKAVKISEKQDINLSNYVETAKVNGDAELIVVKASSHVFFDGYKDYGHQAVTYYPNARNNDGALDLGEGTEVVFGEKFYVIHEEDNEMPRYSNALPEGFSGEYFLAGGNYAILEQPGFYEVIYATAPAAASESFLVQVIKGDEPAEVEDDAEEAAVEEQTSAETQDKPELQPASAVPTASKVLVNGKEVSFEAYTINGNNFFKLRDLAQAVSGSEKQFQVGWDAENNAISLESDKAYTSVGGELAVSADLASQTAVPTGSVILLDEAKLELTAYNINGNNYFKLRDIAKTFNIGVTWDDKTNTVGIDTAIDYIEE